MVLRAILAIVVGCALWYCLFMAVGIGIGLLWPDYRAAAALMFDADDFSLFTTPMLFANMLVFVAAGLGSGWLAAWIGKRPLPAQILSGAMLVLMLYNHYIRVWDDLPAWYNLVIPLIIAGAIYVGGRLPDHGRADGRAAAAAS